MCKKEAMPGTAKARCSGDFAISVKERSKENEGIVWVPNGLSNVCKMTSSVKERSIHFCRTLFGFSPDKVALKPKTIPLPFYDILLYISP